MNGCLGFQIDRDESEEDVKDASTNGHKRRFRAGRWFGPRRNKAQLSTPLRLNLLHYVSFSPLTQKNSDAPTPAKIDPALAFIIIPQYSSYVIVTSTLLAH